MKVGASRGCTEHAFFSGHAAHHGEGRVVIDLDDVVGECEIEHRWDERRCADSLDFVRPGFATLENRALGLDDDAPAVRVALLEVLCDSDKCAAVPRSWDPSVT